MSDHYEIMTLVDSDGGRFGAVFINTATKRVLDLKVFPEVADAEAFAVWVKCKLDIDFLPVAPECVLWLQIHQDEWIKATQKSALAALGEANDA